MKIRIKRASQTVTTHPAEADRPAAKARDEETPTETIASWCVLIVVWFFATTLLAQNFQIPSGSMEKTLLVGDHLIVDRTTFAPESSWMPLAYHREPRRGDIVVFIKPVADYPNGQPEYPILVKRLIAIPGDRIHLHNGVVYVNGVAQALAKNALETPAFDPEYQDEFPALLPTPQSPHGATESWAVEIASHIENGELVVPSGKYFMMGDNRHNSLDSRFWGFVPRENILGRPLFNYWSFDTPDDHQEKTGLGDNLAWMGHVALHFFSDTRWKRTLQMIR
jgi:signal peptidase I